MEKVQLIVNIITSIGVVITLFISVVTIIQKTKISLKQQQSEILTQKRSNRIDSLRRHASEILCEGELYIYDEEVDYSRLNTAVNYYASQLQYISEYQTDIQLIHMVHQIKKMIMSKRTAKDDLKKS